MTTVLSNIVNIFATPTDVFQNIHREPKWLIAFLIIIVGSSILAFFILPFSRQAFAVLLYNKMDEESAQRILSSMKGVQYYSLLFTTLPLLLKWILVSIFLYFGGILLDAHQINFKTVFTVVVYSECIIILMGIINLLLLYVKGADSINNVTDLHVIIGLDYLLADKPHNIPLFTFLNSFNVFSVWYMATLTIGISIVTSFSKLKSAILVTFIWLLGVGVHVILAMLSTNMQHISGQ